MDLRGILEGAGLSDKESRIYLALLELGEAGPAQVAEKAEVKRPTTYVVLGQLRAKDLITARIVGRSELFRAVSPYVILKKQREVYSSVEQALPHLLALNSSYLAAPRIEIFFGVEGIMQIWDDCSRASTDLLFWGDEWLMTYAESGPDHARRLFGVSSEGGRAFVERRKERGVWVRGLLPYESDDDRLQTRGLADAQRFFLGLKREGAENLGEYYFVPRQKNPFKNEVMIYDNKVSTISYEDLVGSVIESEHFADTQRAVFDLCFEYAKSLEKTILSTADKEYIWGLPRRGRVLQTASL